MPDVSSYSRTASCSNALIQGATMATEVVEVATESEEDVRSRYSGKNPIRFAVFFFWRISVRVLRFSDPPPPPPLRPPLGNICCGHRMFLNKIRNSFFVLYTKLVSSTNVARAGKRRNICVGKNVPSFASAFSTLLYTST